MTDEQRFASVWDAIEDTPEAAEKMRRWSAERMALEERMREDFLAVLEKAGRGNPPLPGDELPGDGVPGG